MNYEHRTVLLETQYALDHLVWSYRSQLDRSPTLHLTADDICLSDFASRTAALVRNVLDSDNQRRGPELAFRPPGQDVDRRLAEAVQARRRARFAKAAAAPDAAAVGETVSETVSPVEEAVEELTPDAISPSRLPLRRRF